MKQFSIAIDGPAGAGKSTIAKQLAKKLQCIYIDTGAMYRSVGYYCMQQGIDYNDEQAVEEKLAAIQIDITYKDGTQSIALNGEDVSTAIRTQEVATAASKVATYKSVREALVEMQRSLAKRQSVVMDGRDIGTVVLPDATVKVFLTASAYERAKRRHLEYQEKGIQADFDALLKEIEERDYQDSNRAVSPLKQADDAVCIDSTTQSIEEVIANIEMFIRKKENHE
ncbi:MAG: (d)CMP kinase [Cellulosilyticaceae bacterium]